MVAPVTLNLAAVADHVVWSLAAARPALAVNRRAASWRFRSPDKRPGFASSAPVAQTRLASENRPVLQAPDAETIVTQTLYVHSVPAQSGRKRGLDVVDGPMASWWRTYLWFLSQHHSALLLAPRRLQCGDVLLLRNRLFARQLTVGLVVTSAFVARLRIEICLFDISGAC